MRRNRQCADPRVRRIVRPWRTGVAVMLVAIAAVGSFVAGRLTSPPQRDLLVEANEPTAVFATVERRQVDSRTAFAGVVKEGKVAGYQALPDGVRPVVTRQPLQSGSRVGPGSYLGSVAGRPYFALPGPLPLYRDLREGDSGDDVAALQESLRRLGLMSTTSGQVGPQTMAAMRSLFARYGQRLPTEEARVEVASAQPAGSPTPDASAPPDDESRAASEPATRTVFVSVIPYAQLLTSNGRVGAVVSASRVGSVLSADKPLVAVRVSQSYVVFRADPVAVADLEKGDSVEVKAGTADVPGTITIIGGFTDSGDAPPGHDVTVSVTDGSVASLTPGLSVTILGEGAVTDSLSVPLTAVRQDNASTFVLRRAPDAQDADATERVDVVVQRDGGGWAALADGAVAEGDEVLVS